MDTTTELSRGCGRAETSVSARWGASLGRLTPIDRCHVAPDDSDGIAGVRGVFPNVVIAGPEPRKDRSEHRSAVNSPFQDLDMDALRDAARADLDFPAAQLGIEIDDQRANVLPDIQHNAFGMDPVNVLLSHCFGLLSVVLGQMSYVNRQRARANSPHRARLRVGPASETNDVGA